jgi:hypothetical protein
MNREQALAYGRRKGCRYLVKSSNGSLLGGYTERVTAELAKLRWENEFRENPWCNGENIKVFIEEV